MNFFVYSVTLAALVGFCFAVLVMHLLEVFKRRFHEKHTSGTSARRPA